MGKPLPLDVAGTVIGYWRNGRSYREIARDLDMHRNTVYGIVKRYRERGNLMPRKPTGRPPLTNQRQDRILYRQVRQNRRSSAQSLLREWRPHLNGPVSRRTVNRRLQKRGYMARRLVKVPKLKGRDRVRRRQWAQQHQNRPLGHWQHVVFCDESRFQLFRIDERARVRRLTGEAMLDDCVQPNVAYGGGSVHVWGGIHSQGKTELHILHQNVTGHVYQNIMETHLVPNVRLHYEDNWILAHDNAPAHRARVVEDFLDRVGVTRLEWPPYSPDMNPIEHVWDQMGQALDSVDPQPQTVQQLGVVLLNIWNQIPLERIQNLIDSMPRRVRTLLDARGGPTTY